MSKWCWDEHKQCLFAATMHSSPPLSERIMSDRTGTRWWSWHSHSRNNDVHHSTLLITFHSTYDLQQSHNTVSTSKVQSTFFHKEILKQWLTLLLQFIHTVTIGLGCDVIIFTRVKISVTLSEGSHQESNKKCFVFFSHF